MRNKLLLTTVTLLMAGGLCWQGYVRSQTDSQFGRWVDTPEFVAAGKQAERDTPAARQQFLAIADQHPGTAQGAVSLFSAAHLSGNGPSNNTVGPRSPLHGDCKAVYQRVINEYPNSRFEMMAREKLLNGTEENDQAYIQQMEALLVQRGLPTIADITRDREAAIDRFRAAPAEYRYGAMHIYECVGLRYHRLGREKEDWALELFGSVIGLQGCYPDRFLREKQGIYYVAPPRINPTVRLLKPKKEAGRRPKIEVEITDGDFKQPQIDIPHLSFQLDGQELINRLHIGMKINKKLEEGKVFQILHLKYRPATPLTPGTHTLSVFAPTNGYQQEPGTGTTTASWTFRVEGGDHDDDHESDDDHEPGFE